VPLILGSIAVETVLLALKVVFVVLLYLFIWRIVRAASHELRVPQESFILAPGSIPGIPAPPAQVDAGALIVVRSPVLDEQARYELDSRPLTAGRGDANELALEGDEFASTRHARFETRRDGVWVEDLGSTNGTYVNGVKLARSRRLVPGDIVRVGETDLRYEP
jgi:pSer/pThr/pTyr-binding forkhead associated (FHA) protein